MGLKTHSLCGSEKLLSEQRGETMEIEIYLDLKEADEKDYPEIESRLLDWHREGAEIRYDKVCFGKLTVIDKPHSYMANLADVDPITAIRELHARLYRYKAKIFIHFLP